MSRRIALRVIFKLKVAHVCSIKYKQIINITVYNLYLSNSKYKNTKISKVFFMKINLYVNYEMNKKIKCY